MSARVVTRGSHHREKCKYGARCYNKKESHRARFWHPQEDDSSDSDGAVTAVVLVEDGDSSDEDGEAREPCNFGIQCYQKDPKHFKRFSHPGNEDYHGPDQNKVHWSVETALDIDDRPIAVTSEPPIVNQMFMTQHIFNAKCLEQRPFEEYDATVDETEKVIGVYSHSYAIEQTCLPLLTRCLNCCTGRSERTNSLKITSKRIEVAIDEASGCCPSYDVENPRVGFDCCACCCYPPQGIIQTKALSVADISGYTREVSIPRVLWLSVFRYSLMFYTLFVILATLIALCVDTEVFRDKIDQGLSKFDNSTRLNWGSRLDEKSDSTYKPSNQQTWEVLLTFFLGLMACMTVLYIIVERVMTWGWRFVLSTGAIVTALVLYFWFSIEQLLLKYNVEWFQRQLSIYQDFYVIAHILGGALATLPLFLAFAYCWVAGCGYRVHKLTLHFSNKVSYSVTLLEEQLDDAVAKLASLLGFAVVTPASILGDETRDSGVDMPVDMPGKELAAREWVSGRGGARLTDRALGLHQERKAFCCVGRELSQRTDVYLHDTMTYLERTQNFLPMFWRKLLVFLGLVILINGFIQWLGAYEAYKHINLDWIPSIFDVDLKNLCYFLLSPEFEMILGAVLLLLPFVLQCIICSCACQITLEAEYNWGASNITTRMLYSEAETFEEQIVRHVGARKGGTHVLDMDEITQVGPFTSMPASQCLRPLGCCGAFFGWVKEIEVTDKRIKITEDNGNTVKTYWRDALCEADVGPLAWCVCAVCCPCDGWHRPQQADPIRLSMNFGWREATCACAALPGTRLATTEEFVFEYAEAQELLTKLDPIIGNYVHHEWTPDPVQARK